jgi:TonB family protein
MEKKQKHFIQQPVYKGGSKALTDFIYQNLRYPEAALESGAEGVVLVEYDIDYKGRVVATRVVKSVEKHCDEEACRVVRLLQFEVGKNRGVNVVFHQKAKIQFKVPKPQPAPIPALPNPNAQQPQMAFQYNYTVTTNEPAAPPSTEQPKEQVYSYTITIS